MEQSPTALGQRVLTGTWPVRAHSDRFYGVVQADGQKPRVAAVVCDEGDVIALSLVGFETSTSAVLATIWAREAAAFLVAPDVEWKGPRNLRRKPESYRQFSLQLAGTRESHYIALPLSSHIRDGILHPPDLPKPKEEDIPPIDEEAPTLGWRETAQPIALPTSDRTRYVLGCWDEPAPHPRSFLGHLYGMRVLFLHRDQNHPEWQTVWAEELWKRGRSRRLIEPVQHALGMKAWKISGDLDAWGHLTGSGAREGWLPWKETVPDETDEALVDAMLAGVS
jgi:hypothetical protein